MLPPTASNDLERAFDAGWCLAAKWAMRDDLPADMDSPAYQRERASLLSAIAPKAEGVEAVGEVYTHVVPEDWGRYPEMRSARVEFYGDAPPAGTKLYTHPTPSAVEALARAAQKVAVHHGFGRAMTESTTELCDALAHPEIAALLKGEKK